MGESGMSIGIVQLDEWIDELKSVRGDLPGIYRSRLLSNIIEFLEQTRTNEMLSVTAQMRIADPDPVRRFDNRIEGRANEI